ncbi:MAG TPA: hypothetical protein VF503_15110 [Sphingobium sp.]|uniref:hypothetical protein n=1 Tax=Sphingobium sp. TaxID=1912891 RepID=UPI002ED24D55
MAEDQLHPWTGQFRDLGNDDQLAVARLVKEGGAVIGSLEAIVARLRRTQRLALLRIARRGRIVGVAALKTPAQAYRTKTFTAAGIAAGLFGDAAELGYVVVAADMRGKQLSGGLVEAIAKDLPGATYATTDNTTMRNALQRAGFARLGTEWRGQKGDLTLWTIDPRDRPARDALSDDDRAAVAASRPPVVASGFNHELRET